MTAKNLMGLVKQFFFLLIYKVSFLFFRNKRIWIYGPKFRDNTKYFFLYANENLPEIKHIWISSSKEIVKRVRLLGYKAYYRSSFISIYYALFAKVYIYDTVPRDIINGCLRGSALMFNLWHGVGIKKIEYDITKGPSSFFLYPKNLKEKLKSFLLEPKVFRRSDAVLTTSKKMVPIFSSAFNIPESKVCIGPYPRNSLLRLSKQQLMEFINKFEEDQFINVLKDIKQYNAVIIYMPTFRDTNVHFMRMAIPDFNILHSTCKKHNILFLIKSHNMTRFNENLLQYTHIRNLSSETDVYPLLPFTDVLISDYSSVIIDYSLLRKKIIFYPFDLLKFLKDDREFYFSYSEIFSEKYTATFEDLIKEIDLLGKEDLKSKSFVYSKCLSFVDQTELKDIVNFIKKEIAY